MLKKKIVKSVTKVLVTILSINFITFSCKVVQAKENTLVIENGVLLDGKNAEGEVTIPESVAKISGLAFQNNTEITKIVCPNSLKTIEYGAFSGCSQLSEVKLGSNLTQIGEGAFTNCDIEEVNIPSSIKVIYPDAFDSNVKFSGDISVYNQAKQQGKVMQTINTGSQRDGWRTVDGKYYLKLDGDFKSGWVDYEGKTYYFYSNLQMATGFIDLNGVHYYLDPVKLNNGDLYFNGQNYGNLMIGWQKIKNKWYYFSPTAEGNKVRGFMKTSWLSDGGNWYYLYSNGIMAIGFINLNGAYYYLNNSGAMVSGWNKINGSWYYFNKKSDGGIFGLMKKGWQKIDGKWYYFYPSNGKMAANTWVDGYHVNASGAWDR